MPDRDEVQQVVNAIWRAYDIRNQNLTNTEVRQQIKELAAELANGETDNSIFGGLRRNVAESLVRTYAREHLKHVIAEAS